MTATITPTAKHTGANITRPVDGEGAYMDGGTAPLAPILQTLADRAQYARGSTWGTLIGGDEFSVDTGGTSTVFTARVNAFEAITIRDSSGVFWPIYTSADTTWSLADVEGSPANLSNSTWYYCYLGVNTSGVLTKQISTTAPGASRKWKSTAIDQQRYVGCFRTSGAGAPLPVNATRGRYVYRFTAISGACLAASTNAAVAAYADVSLASFVPPHARVVQLKTVCFNNDPNASDPVVVNVRTKGHTTAADELQVWSTSHGVYGYLSSEIETDSSQAIQWQVLAASSTTGQFIVEIFMRGFSE